MVQPWTLLVLALMTCAGRAQRFSNVALLRSEPSSITQQEDGLQSAFTIAHSVFIQRVLHIDPVASHVDTIVEQYSQRARGHTVDAICTFQTEEFGTPLPASDISSLYRDNSTLASSTYAQFGLTSVPTVLTAEEALSSTELQQLRSFIDDKGEDR